MKKIFLAIAIVAVAAVVFAFTPKSKATQSGSIADLLKPTTTYFYKYTSTSTLIEDIQNRANYQRQSPDCSEEEGELCGVYLPSNTGINNQPSEIEFNAVKADLWTAQDEQNNAHNLDVVMKP